MLRLHVVQAEFGDCLILEFGDRAQPRYILIDGGPSGTHENHLQPVLQEICPGKGQIELAILSHVDNDHVTGLLDLLAWMRQQTGHKANDLTINALWHNAFSQTLDPDGSIHTRLQELSTSARSAGFNMSSTEFTLEGILEGHQLRLSALALGIPINPGFKDGMVRVETAPAPFQYGDLNLWVVGPASKRLEVLRKQWLKWLDKNEARIQAAEIKATIAADTSIPNLSSIMVLAEEEGKKLLLTGDGRGSDLLHGLKRAKLLDTQGKLHLDLLKLPHHGSARNITRKFFQAVTADKYVISANGMYGNPDISTLVWLVETAKEQDRKIEIYLTNPTPSSDILLTTHAPGEYGYTLTFLPTKTHKMIIDV